MSEMISGEISGVRALWIGEEYSSGAVPRQGQGVSCEHAQVAYTLHSIAEAEHFAWSCLGSLYWTWLLGSC